MYFYCGIFFRWRMVHKTLDDKFGAIRPWLWTSTSLGTQSRSPSICSIEVSIGRLLLNSLRDCEPSTL